MLFDNKTNATLTFTENGEVITTAKGVKVSKERYSLIDRKTLELQTSQGPKVVVKIDFTDRNTMNLTAANGIRQTYRRE